MKKRILTIALLFISFTGIAQRGPGHERMTREKFEAARVAFLTSRLDLSTSDAEKFWPIFNELQKERRILGDKYRNLKKELYNNQADNENSSKLIKVYFEQKEAELELERNFTKRFEQVLSPDQVWKLIRFEGDFRRQLMSRVGNYRERNKPNEEDKGNE